MEHSESRPEVLPKISKGRNVCNSNNEDRDIVDIPKSSQFLHKIIVNEDEELPFKHIVSRILLEIYVIHVDLNDMNC